jgi:hypothetical protein
VRVASLLISAAAATASTLGRLGLRLGQRLGQRLGPLIRVLCTLQDLLERHIVIGLHSSLHVSEPRVLTRTVAAFSATTSGLGEFDAIGGEGASGYFFVEGAIGAEGAIVVVFTVFSDHLKLNES